MKRLLAIALALLAGVALAQGSVPNARVSHAWIRWLPAGLPAAGYMTIRNDSDGTLRLAAASSPDYRSVMLHHSRLAHSDSTMEMLDHLDIPAHASVTLAPGSYHLMLTQPTRALHPGDKVPMTLRFAGGQSLQVVFSVLPANATGPSD